MMEMFENNIEDKHCLADIEFLANTVQFSTWQTSIHLNYRYIFKLCVNLVCKKSITHKTEWYYFNIAPFLINYTLV